MMKYIKNTAPYTQRAAVGFVYLDASIICFPTFNTSTTPIKATSEVVLIILVRRIDCGWKKSPDGLGKDNIKVHLPFIQAKTISAVILMLWNRDQCASHQIAHLCSSPESKYNDCCRFPGKIHSRCLAAPKYTRNKSTSWGMTLQFQGKYRQINL